MKEAIPLTWRRIPERYRLLGVTCETCGKNHFPKRLLCPKCRRKGKMVEIQYAGKGKVYILAVIELDEGARLTAQIVDAHKDDVKIGSKVEQVFRVIQRDDPEGLIHYGFKFKLVS